MKVLSALLLGMLLIGIPDSFAQHQIPIEGTVNFNDQTCAIKFGGHPEQSFFLEAVRINENHYDVQIAVNDWYKELIGLSTVLNGSLKILPKKEGAGAAISGQVSSKYTLLKNKPFDEFSSNFTFEGRRLVLHSLSFGSLSLSGNVDFDPMRIDLMIKAARLPLEQVMELVNDKNQILVQGDVDGEIKVQGIPGKLYLSGKIFSYNGIIGSHEYYMAQLKFNGIYPVIQIDDSQIDQKDGFSFKVKGSLDLSDPNSFFTQIKNFVRQPLISGKKSNLEWTLKRLQTPDRGSIEFKYMKRGGSDIGEGADLLGIQRRVEF